MYSCRHVSRWELLQIKKLPQSDPAASLFQSSFSRHPAGIQEVDFASKHFGKFIIPLVLDTQTFPLAVSEQGNPTWASQPPPFFEVASLTTFFLICVQDVFNFEPIDFSDPSTRTAALDIVLERIRSRFHRSPPATLSSIFRPTQNFAA